MANEKHVRATKPEGQTEATVGEAGATPPAPPKFIGGQQRASTYSLRFPMEYDGREYHTATVRRPKGSDFTRFRLNQAAQGDEIAMLALMSDLPVQVILELDGEDFIGLSEAIKPFIPARFLQESGQSS